MTQEEKELLLTDLSARLRYGVICEIDLKPYKLKGINKHKKLWWFEFNGFRSIEAKPYLRPMSSMTEEEKEELLLLMKEETKEMIERMRNDNFGVLKGKYHFNCLKELNWLLENHFDYWGLIERGLAIAVTEENNPYKD